LGPEEIRDLFAAFGPVTPRRMFSGHGIFADDVMFALVINGVVYMKTDAALIPDFERKGSAPFSYARKTGARIVMSLWRLPDRLYDDVDELAKWTQRSVDVARRAAAKPKARRVRRPAPRSPERKIRGRPRK
jgi:DNA transformation protein